MKVSTGSIIKQARLRKELTQNDLAKFLRVSKSTVQKYENGCVQNLKLDTIRSLCIYLDVLPAMILFPEDTSSKTDFNYDQLKSVVSSFYALNTLGQEKARDYMLDLMGNEKYKK